MPNIWDGIDTGGDYVDGFPVPDEAQFTDADDFERVQGFLHEWCKQSCNKVWREVRHIAAHYNQIVCLDVVCRGLETCQWPLKVPATVSHGLSGIFFVLAKISVTANQ